MLTSEDNLTRLDNNTMVLPNQAGKAVKSDGQLTPQKPRRTQRES